jgi:hypothetical protein
MAKNFTELWGNSYCAVVEYSPHHPKVKSLNPAPAADTMWENVKRVHCVSGQQWHSGRTLASSSQSQGFEPHWSHFYDEINWQNFLASRCTLVQLNGSLLFTTIFILNMFYIKNNLEDFKKNLQSWCQVLRYCICYFIVFTL